MSFTKDGRLEFWAEDSYNNDNRVRYISDYVRSNGLLTGFKYSVTSDDSRTYGFYYKEGQLFGYDCVYWEDDSIFGFLEDTSVSAFFFTGSDSFTNKFFGIGNNSIQVAKIIEDGFKKGVDFFPNLKAYYEEDGFLSFFYTSRSFATDYVIKERDSHGNYTILTSEQSSESIRRIITYWDDEPASAKPTQPVAKPATETAPKKAEVTKPVVSKTPGLRPATPKELIVMDLLTRPFGVLSKDSRGLSKEQIMFDLSDYGWKPVLLFEGSQLTMNETSGYDMSFLGRIPERAFAQFTKDNQLWCFTVIFEFDNMKEAERFANQLISSLNSEGIAVPDYNNHNNGHTRKFRYNNSFVYITLPDNMTSYRNKVTVHVSYIESGSWIE